MGISVRDLKYFLETILQCERDDSGDHSRYFLRVNGRIVAQTHYSHSWRGNKQIDDSMLSLQAKQMRCSNRTWKMLLTGKATKEDSFKELFEKGYINKEEFDILCKQGKEGFIFTYSHI